MTRILMATLFTFAIAGCGKGDKDKNEKPVKTPDKPPVAEVIEPEITDEDVPVAADFEEAAEAEVTEKNYKDETSLHFAAYHGHKEMVTLLLARAARGDATPGDLALVDELAETMRASSICGLGQAAPYPVTSVLKHFRHEVESHILERRCPSGVCL